MAVHIDRDRFAEYIERGRGGLVVALGNLRRPDRGSRVRRRLAAGGRWIRNFSSATKKAAVLSGWGRSIAGAAASSERSRGPWQTRRPVSAAQGGRRCRN